MKNNHGFTLIELMIVITIIGILAAIAIPQFGAYRKRAYRAEGFALADPIRKDVIDYYEHVGAFPKNNYEAGLPKPETIKGKYVECITVNNGIIEIKFKDCATSGNSELTFIRPIIMDNNPTGPVIWEVAEECDNQ